MTSAGKGVVTQGIDEPPGEGEQQAEEAVQDRDAKGPGSAAKQSSAKKSAQWVAAMLNQAASTPIPGVGKKFSDDDASLAEEEAEEERTERKLDMSSEAQREEPPPLGVPVLLLAVLCALLAVLLSVPRDTLPQIPLLLNARDHTSHALLVGLQGVRSAGVQAKEGVQKLAAMSPQQVWGAATEGARDAKDFIVSYRHKAEAAYHSQVLHVAAFMTRQGLKTALGRHLPAGDWWQDYFNTLMARLAGSKQRQLVILPTPPDDVAPLMDLLGPLAQPLEAASKQWGEVVQSLYVEAAGSGLELVKSFPAALGRTSFPHPPGPLLVVLPTPGMPGGLMPRSGEEWEQECRRELLELIRPPCQPVEVDTEGAEGSGLAACEVPADVIQVLKLVAGCLPMHVQS